MEKITKEQRKRYNRLIDNQNIEVGHADGATPFVLILMLVLAYFSNKYINGYLALGFIGVAAIVALLYHFRNNKSSIERHS